MRNASLLEDLGRLAPALLFMTDARGQLEFVNERWTELLGVPAPALHGSNWMPFVHEDDLAAVLEAWSVALKTGAPYRGEFRLMHRDGAFRWIEVRAEAERNEHGEVVRWFGAGNEVDAQHRAMDALQLLAESGATANSARDVQALLEGVARAALAGLADIAFFDLTEADGESRRAVVGAQGVSETALAIVKAFPTPSYGEPHPIARAMTELHAMLVARVDEDYIARTILDPSRRDAWRMVGIRSLVVAPMIVGDRRLGALTMLRTLTNRPFESTDVRVVEEVAGRAAVAIENIRLFEAARLDQRTLKIFSELGAVLSGSLEVQPMLDAVLRVVVPEYADWAVIKLADEAGHLHLASQYHRDTGKRAVDELPGGLVVPLMSGGPSRGTLTVGMRGDGRTFRPSDVDMFQRFARRVAPAIVNAQLFERVRRVALTFQDAALPASLPDIPACSFSAIYEAGRAEALIGGDWYDAFALDDGRIVLSIGDVAGSGLLAAVTMANMRQAIRGVAYVHPDPVLMLEAADLALRSESPDRFVTAFVGVIDPIEDTIAFATAGHPPPLLVTPAGEIVALEAAGLPLGLREHDKSASASRGIEPGSTLVLFTDGLIESTHDIEEGYRRLELALRDPEVLAAGNLAARIRDRVLLEGTRDDVAILCAEYAGIALERHVVDVSKADESARFAALLVSELERNGYGSEAVLNAEIVLAELIGNLVRHAPGPATFVIDPHPEHVALHVLDDGPGYRFMSRLPTDTFSERGRGLFLIATLAEAFHVTLRPSGGSHAFVTFSPVSADDGPRTRWSKTSARPRLAG
jgi:PAS domain S-box-containing protein